MLLQSALDIIKRERFLRFLGVGILNSTFSYSIYALLSFLRVNYALAVLAANTLGVLFNFKTTGRLVFQSSNNRLIIRFLAVYAGVYLLSVASLKALLELKVSRYLAGAMIALPMAGVSYLLMRHFVFQSGARKSRPGRRAEQAASDRNQH